MLTARSSMHILQAFVSTSKSFRRQDDGYLKLLSTPWKRNRTTSFKRSLTSISKNYGEFSYEKNFLASTKTFAQFCEKKYLYPISFEIMEKIPWRKKDQLQWKASRFKNRFTIFFQKSYSSSVWNWRNTARIVSFNSNNKSLL